MANMKHLVTAMASVGFGLSLSGCGMFSGGDVYALQATVAQGGTPFTRALADQYRAAANEEATVEAEWDDADWFAGRGLQSAAGQLVLPVDPATLVSWHWRVPPSDRLAVLQAGRAQLMAALDGGARERVPAQAAQVQVLYDCWAEEEAENEVDNCAADFRRLITTIQVTQVMPEQGGYQVFFDWDRSNITATAAQVIRQAADIVRGGGMIQIGVTGHTDSSGPNSYNQRLSERRAKAVRGELVRDGVPAGEIQVMGVGEADQLVPTADGVREPRNRRAVIVPQK